VAWDDRLVSTTSRRLETLSLLQAHPGICATRLAARLGVTERTARRDVAHPRELGYRIDAEAGPAGGYRLASGRAMPPLLLDADEVAAVALGLRTSASRWGQRRWRPARTAANASGWTGPWATPSSQSGSG
jgi:predicted DNA-binding transcriptional regulator YafY